MLLPKILLLLSLPLMAFSSEKKTPPKVVVVGAGIAGLTTAYRLQQLGIDVEIYEARARVGGRILSVQINGQMGELGGQNLSDGGEAQNLRRLIEECDLEIQSRVLPLNMAWFTGEEFIPDQALFSLFDPESLKKHLNDRKSGSMVETLNSLFASTDPAFKYLSVRLAAYEGATPEQLSSLYKETLYHMILGGVSAVHQEGMYHLETIKGGNSLLPEKMAKNLDGRVHLNSPLTSVSKALNGAYTLLFQNGRTSNADILVLAIPCSVYEDIQFEENVIPIEKLAAIRSVLYGSNAKILIPFLEVPEMKFAPVNDHCVTFFDTQNQLLTCYYTGESSRFSAETIEDVLKKDQPMLEIGYGFSRISPIMASDPSCVYGYTPVGYSWPSDPYVKGSYHYIAPGQEILLTSTEVIFGETVKTLFAPIENTLYFAGEHVSILEDVPGTMEAACESGERAARMIAAGFCIRPTVRK